MVSSGRSGRFSSSAGAVALAARPGCADPRAHSATIRSCPPTARMTSSFALFLLQQLSYRAASSASSSLGGASRPGGRAAQHGAEAGMGASCVTASTCPTSRQRGAEERSPAARRRRPGRAVAVDRGPRDDRPPPGVRLVHRAAFQLQEADPHSLVHALAPWDGAEITLLELQMNEYGGLQADRGAHGVLFADTMVALGLDPVVSLEPLPAATLATRCSTGWGDPDACLRASATSPCSR